MNQDPKKSQNNGCSALLGKYTSLGKNEYVFLLSPRRDLINHSLYFLILEGFCYSKPAFTPKWLLSLTATEMEIPLFFCFLGHRAQDRHGHFPRAWTRLVPAGMSRVLGCPVSGLCAGSIVRAPVFPYKISLSWVCDIQDTFYLHVNAVPDLGYFLSSFTDVQNLKRLKARTSFCRKLLWRGFLMTRIWWLYV